MIELYDKVVSQDPLSFETVYRFTEDKDSLTLKNDNPIIGATKVLSLTVETFEGKGFVLEKFFRYTLDSLNWSEFKELSEVNLKKIDIKKNHFFDIEYRFVCKEVKYPGEKFYPELKSVSIDFEYEIPQEPELYKNFFYKKFFPFYNSDSIKWSLNVLNKIYKSGILAKYVERDTNRNWSDEDFIDFWWPIIYFYALRLNYNNVYTKLYWYPELLKKYLEQKGIFLGSKTRLDECIYLMLYYYDEISRRGSVSVLEKKKDLPQNFENVTIRGELLRLIDKEDSDEFLSAIIPSDENGWIVGRTCPLFSETDTYKGYVKGYEITEDVVDLDKYPLEDPSRYDIVQDGERKVLHFTTTGGIGSKDSVMDLPKLVGINPLFSYEVSLKFRTDAPSVRLLAGAKCTDSVGTEIFNPFTKEGNVSINTNLKINRQDSIHYLSFAILGKDETNILLPTNEYFFVAENSGKTNLQFKSEDKARYLSPFILFQSPEGSNLYVWDIKVRLLDRKTIFISSIQEMVLYLKNNNYFYTTEELQEIIGTYLLPFTVNLTLNEYGQ